MSRHRDWIVGLSVAGITLLLIFILVTYLSQKQQYDGVTLTSRGDKVAVVELMGPIYDARHIVRQFKGYSDHSSVKAIVFRIESPGGGVAASQEIYEMVRRVRDEGKPVIVSMGSVAASGGYYVACGADTIVANPGTTTGSIGVIMELPNIEGLLNKVGIHYTIIKSGRFKDSGSPYRDLTSADQKYFQSFVDDAFQQFVKVVADERGLSHDQVLRLADGRVFTGKQAYEAGLVDILGDYETAIRIAAEAGDITGDPVIVKERRRRLTLFDLLFQRIEGMVRGLSGVALKYSIGS